MRLSGGLQCEMCRVEGDLWAVAYRVRRIDEAFVSYHFVVDDDYAAAVRAGRMAVWRGPAAPAAPVSARQRRGELRTRLVPSRHLPAPRAIHAYLSPGWRDSPRTLVVQAADAAHRAGVIEPLVLEGVLPPVVCIGVEFLGRDNDGRADEYLPSRHPARFSAHLAFQTEECQPGRLGNLACHRPGRAGW